MHRLAPTVPEIGKEDGFDKTDIFDLKPFGERLAAIVEDTIDPLVIAIDGPWGSGQSVFAKQWAGLLRQRGTPVIEFDAFANDYQEDAFIALAAEIVAYSKETLKEEGAAATVQSFVKKAASVMRALVPVATKVAIKAATLGVFSKEDGEDLTQAIEAGATDVGAHLEKAIQDRLNTAESASALMKGFGAELSKLAGKLAKRAKPDVEDVPPRLVIIIDELDRCKPSFALDLLEKIKHFYNVEGVSFVLITNLEQIEAAVRGRYGTETNASLYLQKFISLKFTWTGHDEKDSPASATYVRKCLESMNASIVESAIEVVEFVCRRAGLSLRQVEKICSFMMTCPNYFSGSDERRESESADFIALFYSVGQIDKDVMGVNITINLNEKFITLLSLHLSNGRDQNGGYDDYIFDLSRAIKYMRDSQNFGYASAKVAGEFGFEKNIPKKLRNILAGRV